MEKNMDATILTTQGEWQQEATDQNGHVAATPSETVGQTRTELQALLLKKIENKRGEVKVFIRAASSKHSRLSHMAITFGALSTVVSLSAAVFGKALTGLLTQTVGVGLPVWQVICLVAGVLAVLATATTSVSEAHETESRLVRAQAFDAKLEGLETQIELGDPDIEPILEHYVKALADVPFI